MGFLFLIFTIISITYELHVLFSIAFSFFIVNSPGVFLFKLIKILSIIVKFDLLKDKILLEYWVLFFL